MCSSLASLRHHIVGAGECGPVAARWALVLAPSRRESQTLGSARARTQGEEVAVGASKSILLVPPRAPVPAPASKLPMFVCGFRNIYIEHR